MRVLCLISFMSMAVFCKPQSNPGSASSFTWDANRVMSDLQVFAAEPHPMGSPRIQVLADYIEKEMKASELKTSRQKFDVEVPDPELLDQEASMMQKTTLTLPLQNITAKYESSGAASCVYLVGSHYDSKRLENAVSIGANDSGSSSAALLELMRRLHEIKPDFRCQVMAVWFDGEGAYLSQWRDGETRHPARIVDNTYGSRKFVDSLTACEKAWCLPESMGGEKVEGLILLDMIGSTNLKLSPESNSTSALMNLAREIDQQIFSGQLYGNTSAKAIEDDHIPFLKKGIPAVDLIGFESLEHWHKPSDTIDKVSIKSMQEGTTLAYGMLVRLLGE